MNSFEQILIKQPEKIKLSDQEITYAVSHINSKMVDLKPKNFKLTNYFGYKKIVVVGNQRSGTTFTAKYLAKALNFKYVDESAFEINDVYKFIHAFKDKTVVQAPALTIYIHKIITQDDLVVFMVRDWSDILKSILKKNKSLSNMIYMQTVYKYHLAKWIDQSR